MKKSSRFGAIVTYTVAILLVLIVVLPLLWALLMSFKQPKDIITWPPKFIFKPTLKNYKEVLLGTNTFSFVKVLLNSIVITGISTVATVTLASITAYSISRLKPKGSALLNFIILGVRMVPSIVLVVPLYIIYNNLGLLDTRIGLIAPFTALSIPFATWTLEGFFLDIPKNIEEAAMIDGCTPFETLWKVILPLAAPGVAATSIFSFILSWNDLTIPLPLTMTEAITLPVFASLVKTDDGILWGQVGSVSVIMILPIIFFTIFATKYLIKGIAGGAVKG